MSEIEPSIITKETKGFEHRDITDAIRALGYIGMPNIVMGDAWMCVIEPDHETVIINSSSFGDERYKPEWQTRALQHEVKAHYVVSKQEPETSIRTIEWMKEHPAGKIFTNILADIAGNRAIMALDPSAREDFKNFYRELLFRGSDYRYDIDKDTGMPSDKRTPRHIQFLYAALREKMVTDEKCIVDDEVRHCLEELKKFAGKVDILDYSTQPFKSPTQYLTRTEQMNMWRNAIWPKFLELYDADLEDRKEQTEASQGNNQGQGNNDQNGGEPSKGDGNDGEGEDKGDSNSTSSSRGKEDEFKKYYEEYDNEKHPGGKPDKSKQDGSQEAADAIKKIMDGIPKTASKTPGDEPGSNEDKPQGETKEPNIKDKKDPEPLTNRQSAKNYLKDFAVEKGVTPEELNNYLKLQRKVIDLIGELHGVFEKFINERITLKWRLSHQHPEGVLLDPDNLTRTFINIKTGDIEDSKPFMDYTRTEKEREMSGKFDMWLVVDCSGSMADDNKAYTAALSTVAILEGLDDYNRVIRETSNSLGYNLDLDAQTAIIGFGSGAKTIKPLGKELTIKQRCQTVEEIQRANQGSTDDYSAIEIIIDHYGKHADKDRKKIIVVITDGESSDVSSLNKSLNQARRIPNASIYAIGIVSKDAEVNYAPNGQTINDVKELPETLTELVISNFV